MTKSFRGSSCEIVPRVSWLSSIKPLNKRLQSITDAACVRTNNNLFPSYNYFPTHCCSSSVPPLPLAYQSPNITKSRYIRICFEWSHYRTFTRQEAQNPSMFQLPVWKALYSGQITPSKKDGSQCFAQDEIESTCVYWTRNLISYQTVFLHPDTSLCVSAMCTYCVFVSPSVLYTYSLSASTLKASCFSAPSI